MTRNDPLNAEDYDIVEQCNIRPKYWELLEIDMRKTGKFNPNRLKHVLLRQTCYAGRMEVRPATDGHVPREQIWACAARLKTKDPKFQELAWFYVQEGKEGNGALRDIVDNLIAKAPADIKYFGFSTELPAWKVFMRHGLVAITKYSFPGVEEWAKRLGIYDRLPETAFRTDPPAPKEGERWLFSELSRL